VDEFDFPEEDEEEEEEEEKSKVDPDSSFREDSAEESGSDEAYSPPKAKAKRSAIASTHRYASRCPYISHFLLSRAAAKKPKAKRDGKTNKENHEPNEESSPSTKRKTPEKALDATSSKPASDPTPICRRTRQRR
jgi:hypothetical protein